jgi:predicted GH43/DUF377 family glycosyl hydrolase
MPERPENELKANLWWLRDPTNPVLPPGKPGTFDSTCCMNPFVLRKGDAYHLYYAGGDDKGRRRICLATAHVDDLSRWERHGPLFDLGDPGSFDANWCVLPHVVQFAPDRWHLYYTGNCGRGEGPSAFPGIGLAVSEDGRNWRKYEAIPLIGRTGRDGDPDAQGVAGGSVLSVRLPDGGTEWRFYYTGCPTLGDDLFLHQQKAVCLAISQDGIRWEKRGAVMLRDPERDYENVAAAGPVVHQSVDGTFRMWYSAIGTRWGAYSICYAESEDGIHWRRGGHYGDNLQLSPAGNGWERQMVEYPSAVREERRLRLFYCGNGYGGTGIGTAVAAPLRATATQGPCLARIVSAEADAHWDLRIPEGLSCDEGVFKIHHHPVVDWHGPDANGTLWHEWQTNPADFETISAYSHTKDFGLIFIRGIHYRVLLTPTEDGLALKFTATNLSDQTFHDLVVFPCLGHPSENFEDNGLERTFIVTESGLTALKDTDRGTGDPCRTHFRVSGCPAMRFYGSPFWGEPSRTLATSGAVLRARTDGRFTVGMSWDQVAEVFHNEDSHHCIRSLAAIRELKPGETRSVRGKLVLVQGGPEQALKLLD